MIKAPTTFTVNTPRMQVKYLAELALAVNDINGVIAPLRAEQVKKQAAADQKEEAKVAKQTEAESKAQANERQVKRGKHLP